MANKNLIQLSQFLALSLIYIFLLITYPLAFLRLIFDLFIYCIDDYYYQIQYIYTIILLFLSLLSSDPSSQLVIINYYYYQAIRPYYLYHYQVIDVFVIIYQIIIFVPRRYCSIFYIKPKKFLLFSFNISDKTWSS